MKIIKQVVDLINDQVIRGVKTFLNKINISTGNSPRTYYLEIGADNTLIINSDPGGSIRATEYELNFRSTLTNLTRDAHGSNIKCIISTDANSSNLRTLSGNYYAANFYSNLTSTHTTVNRIAGINALADVGSNLTGTTITNLTSILGRGVAARTNTVVTNAHAIYGESPKHGVNRYTGFFEEPTGGTGENFSIKTLGDVFFQKTITINGRKITYSDTEPLNANPFDIWYETSGSGISTNVKQAWFRTGESILANRRWLSLDLHTLNIKIKEGILSADSTYIPISFSNRYGYAIETVFIQAFISNISDLANNNWAITIDNGYGVTATESSVVGILSNTDFPTNGANAKKTFTNMGYVVNGVQAGGWAYRNTTNPQQILWLRVFKNGVANQPNLTDPTIFFEYRFVRP